MTDRRKGNLLVGIQFVLLAAIILVPTGAPIDGFPSIIAAIGSFMVWPGLAIVAASVLKLGQSLTASPIPKEQAKLKTDGLYRWIRHPIYTGLMLTTLGVALEAGSIVKLIFVACLFLLFDFKAKWEETLLLNRFPEYQGYMSTTGRFVPRLNR